jgi:hypothetical protein
METSRILCGFFAIFPVKMILFDKNENAKGMEAIAPSMPMPA